MGSPRTGVVTVLFMTVDEPGELAADAREELLGRAEQVLTGITRNDTLLGRSRRDNGGISAAFADPAEALRCAMALRSAIQDVAPGVRMALASATSAADATDATGNTGATGGAARHRAAALCAAGHPGQVLLTDSALRTATAGMPPGMAVRDLGVHLLADLGPPERIHQLLPAGAADQSSPPRSLSTLPNNLPVPPSTLIGREGELAETSTLLADSRLLTLTGPGGCGKSRLALRLGAEVLPSFPDGAWWVDLAAVSVPPLVPASVAAVLDVRERADEPLVDSLATALAGRRALVILDNCEHVIDACAELLDCLLPTCPSLTVLVTSRAVLGVSGERVYRVPPLPVPELGAPAAAIAQADAVRLFTDRARSAEPSLSLTGDDLSAIAEICRRLDGIPLAIELAAARTSLLTPAEIADGLSERFTILTSTTRHLAARQRSLEASLSWSYHLLDPGEREFLAGLAAFSGGWTLEAAREVCGGGDLDTGQTLEILSGLVDKSLIQVDRSSRTRYRLLESVRAYAWERLIETARADAVRHRHLDYYLRFAEAAAPDAPTSAVSSWLERLHPEVCNLRSAMDWALATQRVEPGLRIAAATWTYWLVRGHYGEMRDRMEASLAAAADVDPAVRCRALIAAIMVWFTGNFAKTRVLAQEAARLAREAGTDVDLHRAVLWCGWTEYHLGEGPGRPLLDEALLLAREAGEPTNIARAAMYLGHVTASSGDVAGGTALLDEALTLARGGDHLPLVSSALMFRGCAEITGGELSRAEESLIEGLAIARSLHYGIFTAMSLANLAWVRILTGRATEAIGAAEEAIAVARESGAGVAESLATAHRGLAAYADGDLDVAETWFRTTVRLETDSGLALPLCVAEWGLGAIARRRGDFGQAWTRLVAAARTAAQQTWWRGRVLLEQARLAADEADPLRAEELAHRAAGVLAGLGDEPGVCEAVEVLAGLAATHRGAELAIRLGAAATAARERTGAPRLPILDRDLRNALAPAAESLGSTGHSAAIAQGSALPLAEALAYAARGRGERRRPATGWASLTPVELQVTKLVAEGLTNPQIAERLFITRNTVKTHLRSVFGKLGVATRSQLASGAARRQVTG